MKNTANVHLVVHISVCAQASKHVLELRSVTVAYASAKSADTIVRLSDKTEPDVSADRQSAINTYNFTLFLFATSSEQCNLRYSLVHSKNSTAAL